jgi:tetratricopeptide (TPR) repeat protein
MFKNLIPILICCVFANVAYSQETISRRDSEEIKLLAQRRVEKGLTDLLNTLTQEDLGEAERKFMITESFTAAKNPLFNSPEVVVEDDIQPDHNSAVAVMDLKIEKYLTNLDLFYSKGTQRTIQFSNFSVSNVKKTDFIYAKVFFTSTFKGKYSQSDKPYIPTRRVAEVRATKNGKKWIVSISRIAFFSANDSLNAKNNDLIVKADEPAATETTTEESSEVSKERADANAAIAQYNQLMADGRKAFAAKNYEDALEAFTKADKINPLGDYLALIQISKVKRALTESLKSDDDIVKEFANKAETARKRRNYPEAIDWYRKILDKKPDSTAVADLVKSLSIKDRTKTELDEKFAASRYKELVKDYDKIIKKEADNSDWYLGRGKCYLKLNDTDRSLKDLNKAIELDFANIPALMARAELYKKLNNSPKAVADYTSILNMDKQNAEVYSQRAALRVSNSLSAAFDDYGKAIEFDNKNAKYFYQRGLLNFQNNKLPQALSDFSDATMRRTDDPNAYYQRGQTYVSLKKFQEAGADFAIARQLELNDFDAGQIDSVAVGLYRLGKRGANDENYKGAAVAFTSALYINPKMSEAWLGKGEVFGILKQYGEAIKAYSAAIKLEPSNSDYYYQRGWICYKSGDYENAAADFRQTYDLNADAYDGLLNEARSLIALDKYQEAIAPLRAIKNAQKQIEKKYDTQFFTEAYYFLGICEYQTEEYQPAIEDYTAALKINEKYSDAYYNRGLTWEALGKLDKAVDDYQKAIDLTPNQAYQFLAKAGALEKKGKFADAMTDYNRAILNDKQKTLSPQAMIGRGRCRYETGQYADALKDIDQARKADEALETTDTYLMLGRLYTLTNETEKATSYFKKCIEDDNFKGWGNYGMACTFLEQNNETEALNWFTAAFQTGQLSAEVVKKDKFLDAVKKEFRKNKDFKGLIAKYLK